MGGNAPVSIQTMAKAQPTDVDRIVAQLAAAHAAGCDIGRIAVPDEAAARTIREIQERCGMPVVADIHFDYRCAVAAIKAGAAAIRINPGTLGGTDALRAVVAAAAEAGTAIRVGVNAGSLPKRGGQPVCATAQAMTDTALFMIAEVEALGFHEIKVSLKAFDLTTTVEANRMFAACSNVPLHLGVTEAGPLLAGAVRSAATLALLLQEGIGDTIRISLTADPVEEVRAARFLLTALTLRPGGVVVSCPTCGRTSVDLLPIAERIEAMLLALNLDRVVAVMGCEVNGPGEARAADLGIAYGSKGVGVLFEAGRIVGRYTNSELEGELIRRLQKKEIRDGS